MKGPATLFALALMTLTMAGCLTGSDDLELVTGASSTAYVAVDTEALSEPIHDILPRATTRVPVTIDGINLFVEYWLPDGEGPWPVILHSTPYSHLDRAIDTIAGNTYRDFFVPRGYAYVVADVRGFGESEGCVEVWGPQEQQDQYDLVEWAGTQEWSDGNVGMIGVSYPGTTPIEAAVMAPPSLKAMVAVAGLTDPYFDWHYGGVPNGESGPVGSPAAYHGIGAASPQEVHQGPDWLTSVRDTGCGAVPLVLDAYSMDGTYTDFYAERNFSARVKEVQAAVLYSQGFRDGNVKPSQLLHWFNELDVPKKGFFGHWGHQNPPRDDWGDMVLAWFDQYLKSIETGVMDGPTVEAMTNVGTWRADGHFPSRQTESQAVWAAFDGNTLRFEAPEELRHATLRTDRVQATLDSLNPAVAPDRLELRSAPFTESLYLTGTAHFRFDAVLEGDDNAFVRADLYSVAPDGKATRVTFGSVNLALRDGFTKHEPVPQGEPITTSIRFQPTETVIEPGHRLRLVLSPVNQNAATTPEASGASTLTFMSGGGYATFLDLPVLDGRPDQLLPSEVKEEE